jgi:adenine phosphoribosyltransferase
VDRPYELEYGSGVLEMQRGAGRLMLVDDVLATGGTFAAATELAADAGFRVEQAGVLIDLGIVPQFRFLGLALRTVIRYGG